MAVSNLLLVEGNNDKHFLLALLKHHFQSGQSRDDSGRDARIARIDIANKQLAIKDKDNLQNLLATLPDEIEGSDLERVGIIVDADNDPGKRWSELRKRLIEAGYDSIPPEPDPAGALLSQPDKPLVGIWLMPDNQNKGNLEVFASGLVPARQQTLWDRAGRAVKQIPAGERQFKPKDQAKAHLYTYLAWQTEPGMPLGKAVSAQYFEAGAPSTQPLIDWLGRLFGLARP